MHSEWKDGWCNEYEAESQHNAAHNDEPMRLSRTQQNDLLRFAEKRGDWAVWELDMARAESGTDAAGFTMYDGLAPSLCSLFLREPTYEELTQ